MNHFILLKSKCYLLAIVLAVCSTALYGMTKTCYDTPTNSDDEPETEIVSIAAEKKAPSHGLDFPPFIDFTEQVLGLAEHNFPYSIENAQGQPKGLYDIVTPAQFAMLATTFIQNQAKKVAHRDSPYILKKAIDDEPELCFIGDIHGSIHSIVRNLWNLIINNDIDQNLKITNEALNIVFLGDYIDGGRYNLLTIALLLKLSNNNPDHVFLCRGNHEHEFQDSKGLPSNLESEIKAMGNPLNIRHSCEFIFGILPIMIFFTIEGKGHIRCCHGGGFFTLIGKHTAEDQISAWIEDGPAVLPLAKLAEETHKAIKVKHPRLPLPLVNDTIDFLINRITWGDFKADNLPTGIRKVSSLSYSQTQKIFADANELAEHNPTIKPLAIFRGHQDFGCDLKFFTPSADDFGDGLQGVPTKIRSFDIKSDEYLPIFTLSTASEGKGLPASSFIFLNTAPSYEEWKAQRRLTILGTEDEHDYRTPLRHYPATDFYVPVEFEGLYSHMKINLGDVLSLNPITLEWDRYPYSDPLELVPAYEKSPVPDRSPAPTAE